MNAQPLPEMQDALTRHVDSLNTVIPLFQGALERAEVQRREALLALGQAIRDFDQMLALLTAEGAKNTSEGLALMKRIREARDTAFAAIKQYAPDEAYYWTPEWQLGEREADADKAQGRTAFYPDDESFEAALRAHV